MHLNRYRTPIVTLMLFLLLSGGCSSQSIENLEPEPGDPSREAFLYTLVEGDVLEVRTLDGEELTGVVVEVAEYGFALKVDSTQRSELVGEPRILRYAEVEIIILLDREARDTVGLIAAGAVGAVVVGFLIMLSIVSGISGWRAN